MRERDWIGIKARKKGTTMRRCARGLEAMAIAAALAGCAVQQTTPYQPLNPDGTGYSEQRIEANRYRVTFTGNSLTAREEVENYMLFRIAELTLDSGYDYFILSNSDTEARTYYLQSMTGYNSADPFYGCFWPHSAFSFGTSTPITNYKAQAYVVMFKGSKPDSDINAFNAREVHERLSPLVRRTAEPAP